MNSHEGTKTLPPRPMRGNTLLGLLAGAATVVVVSGSMTCRPLDTLGDNTLGIYIDDSIEWGTADWEDLTWEDFNPTGETP